MVANGADLLVDGSGGKFVVSFETLQLNVGDFGLDGAGDGEVDPPSDWVAFKLAFQPSRPDWLFVFLSGVPMLLARHGHQYNSGTDRNDGVIQFF